MHADCQEMILAFFFHDVSPAEHWMDDAKHDLERDMKESRRTSRTGSKKFQWRN